jgi:GNAT superfamily N-acetyltransferase
MRPILARLGLCCGAVDDATLSALDANYLDASRAFVTGAPGGEYVERRDLALVCCGLPAQALNFGFLRRPHDDVAASAAAARAYFEGRKLPHQLSYRDASGAPARALEAAGWQRRPDPTPGMALALPVEVPEAPTGIAIEEVRTPEQLVAFRETAFRGFGYPPAVAHRFLGDALLALPNVRLYAGRAGGEVVATSILFTTGAVAGIYWVATLEAARGRGYGAALTWAAVRGGSEAGCRIASLQASALGRPVYARMGFAHVLDYEHLLPAEG